MEWVVFHLPYQPFSKQELSELDGAGCRAFLTPTDSSAAHNMLLVMGPGKRDPLLNPLEGQIWETEG